MLEQFAKQYRVKIRRNTEDGTEVIEGRWGNIYEYSTTELGVMFLPPLKPGQTARTGMWNARRLEAESAGMVLRQSGDGEGSLSFDPSNPKQAAIALKIAQPKRRRRASPEQLATLARHGFKARPPALEGLISS